MGDDRAEGSSAIGDSGQAAISLMRDMDGTYICICESSQLEGSYVCFLSFSGPLCEIVPHSFDQLNISGSACTTSQKKL